MHIICQINAVPLWTSPREMIALSQKWRGFLKKNPKFSGPWPRSSLIPWIWMTKGIFLLKFRGQKDLKPYFCNRKKPHYMQICFRNISKILVLTSNNTLLIFERILNFQSCKPFISSLIKLNKFHISLPLNIDQIIKDPQKIATIDI